MKKFVYYEEYKHCSCTTIERDKDKLPGYCKRHGNSIKFYTKLPDNGNIELGFIET